MKDLETITGSGDGSGEGYGTIMKEFSEATS
jgi:hypothetical protein